MSQTALALRLLFSNRKIYGERRRASKVGGRSAQLEGVYVLNSRNFEQPLQKHCLL